jgi:acyl carrier protein
MSGVEHGDATMADPEIGESTEMDVVEKVRRVVESTSELDGGDLGDSDNLFEAGLTSMDLVALALRLEEAFDVRITDDWMMRESFESIDSITAMIRNVATR